MNNTIENIAPSPANDFGFLCTDYYANDFTEGAIHCRGGINVNNTLEEDNDHLVGYLVPEITEKYIIQALESEDIMRRLATVIHTAGTNSSTPVETHVPEAQCLAEDEAINIMDTAFDTRTIKQHKLAVMIHITKALAKDTGVDIREFPARLFAQSIAGAEDEAFITGDGVKCPTGILADGGAQTALTIQSADAITPFSDTADCLYQQVSHYVMEKYGLHTAEITGTVDGKTTIPRLRVDLNTVFTCFSSVSKAEE